MHELHEIWDRFEMQEIHKLFATILNKMNYACQPYEIQELKDPYKVDEQIELNQVYELHKLH